MFAIVPEINMQISTELAQAILNYLANRPYGEVFQLITAIQAAAQPKEQDDAIPE